MIETVTVLSPLHCLYLAGVVVILTVMIMRKDTPAVCIGFLFLLGVVGMGSLIGGIQTVFNAMLYAAKEFMEVIATIALVTALSKCLSDLGSDYLLMRPMSKVMKSPSVTWWILGLTMLLFSLFLWPSPSVALVGAIMLPFAVRAGLNPLAAAVAMNLFGHGCALSYDVVIQGAPAISAASAGISTSQILTEGRPVFLVMGISTVIAAFLLNRKTLVNESVIKQRVKTSPTISISENKSPEDAVDVAGELMCDLDREVFCIINLKADGTPINCHFASMGAIDQAIAEPREVFKAGILSNASKMIPIHNHPSGNLFPSKEDCGITDRLLRLSGLLGIPIVDHIIVGGDNRKYFSFHEHCLIENPVIKYASCCEDISMDRFGKVENLEKKTENCGEEKQKAVKKRGKAR